MGHGGCGQDYGSDEQESFACGNIPEDELGSPTENLK